jgi:carbon monoxide dehydrogenase subunit G
MLRFEGDHDFPQPPADLFAKLSDARFLVSCIPDVEKISEQESDRAVFTVRPGLAFARGTLEVTLRIVDKAPPASARMVMTSKGVGSSSTVEAALGLAPHPNPPPPAGGGHGGGGTRMHWIAEVKDLGGLLKMVPQGLIRGAAQKVLNDAWTAVEAQLRETA